MPLVHQLLLTLAGAACANANGEGARSGARISGALTTGCLHSLTPCAATNGEGPANYR